MKEREVEVEEVVVVVGVQGATDKNQREMSNRFFLICVLMHIVSEKDRTHITSVININI